MANSAPVSVESENGNSFSKKNGIDLIFVLQSISVISFLPKRCLNIKHLSCSSINWKTRFMEPKNSIPIFWFVWWKNFRILPNFGVALAANVLLIDQMNFFRSSRLIYLESTRVLECGKVKKKDLIGRHLEILLLVWKIRIMLNFGTLAVKPDKILSIRYTAYPG